MPEPTQLCFVVGPIGEKGTATRKAADLVLELIIKPVITGNGYRVKRADDDARPGSITAAVIQDVLAAELVIADLTGFNPNAFYELGIRHASGKPTIHLTTDGAKPPFDVSDQRTIFVDMGDWASITDGRKRLNKAVTAVAVPGFNDSNPVTQARGAAALAASGDDRDRQMLEMQSRLEGLENLIREGQRPVRRTLRRESAGLGLAPDEVIPAIAEFGSAGSLLGRIAESADGLRLDSAFTKDRS